MRKFTILSLLGYFIFFSSCEKEENVQIRTDLTIQKNESIVDYFERLESSGLSSIEIKQALQNLNAKQKPDFQKVVEIAGVTIYNSEADFAGLCAGLNYEDFDEGNLDYSPGYGVASTGSLNSSTNSDVFSTGDITSGLTITSLNEDLIVLDYTPFAFDLFKTVTTYDSAIIMNFDEPVSNVGFMAYDLGGVGATITLKSENGEMGKIFLNSSFAGTYFGIASEIPITEVSIYQKFAGSIFVDNITFGSCSSDTDGDGCDDNEDPFVESNLEETIVLGSCDTGVENKMTEACGVSMADLLLAASEETNNHGSYVSVITKLTRNWVTDGLISANEKGAILNCAAKNK